MKKCITLGLLAILMCTFLCQPLHCRDGATTRVQQPPPILVSNNSLQLLSAMFGIVAFCAVGCSYLVYKYFVSEGDIQNGLDSFQDNYTKALWTYGPLLDTSNLSCDVARATDVPEETLRRLGLVIKTQNIRSYRMDLENVIRVLQREHAQAKKQLYSIVNTEPHDEFKIESLKNLIHDAVILIKRLTVLKKHLEMHCCYFDCSTLEFELRTIYKEELMIMKNTVPDNRYVSNQLAHLIMNKGLDHRSPGYNYLLYVEFLNTHIEHLNKAICELPHSYSILYSVASNLKHNLEALRNTLIVQSAYLEESIQHEYDAQGAAS